ncbi:aminotransferase class IV [Segetibacter aerophilus]|uniref:branched-chain-amino-acid transaminase n=1 Tax=Segetibacter aerophilus TaxID=670293 RepID=A0A512BF88_9BACT|nr:aminotransferase class IV [Segetibacter aerophilus]GEO10612.1 D-amino acid aminotransferase [Segetibacter aerophilus]
MIVFINDRFIDEKEASIGISDLSVQRGFGIFDFFRTYRYVPLFLDDYLDRFFNSATLLSLQPRHTREELKTIIYEMIDRNQIETSGFKLILTGGYSQDGFEPGTPNFIMTQQPVEISSEEKFEKGIRIILHEYLRDVPEVKSINYLMAIYLQNRLVEQKADDVLYHQNGEVLEFPRSNVFIVTKEGAVVTPGKNVLHGITRKKVLHIAGRNYKAEERTVTLEDLKNASEVFLTSSTKRLLPVLEIDDVIVGNGKPGKITRELYTAFKQLEEEYYKHEKLPLKDA